MKKFTGLKKTLGVAGKALSFLDTVEMVNKVAQASSNVIDKELARRHELKKDLIAIPNVNELPLEQAQAHLEGLGFTVVPILAKANTAYRTSQPQQVVQQVPRSGQAQVGSLIKLYYVDAAVIEASQVSISLPSLAGLTLEQASQILEKHGFDVVAIPVAAQRHYAKKPVNTVIASEPRASLLTKHLDKRGLVKLRYLDEKGLAESQALQVKYQQQLAQIGQGFNQAVQQVKKIISKNK